MLLACLYNLMVVGGSSSVFGVGLLTFSVALGGFLLFLKCHVL